MSLKNNIWIWYQYPGNKYQDIWVHLSAVKSGFGFHEKIYITIATLGSSNTTVIRWHRQLYCTRPTYAPQRNTAITSRDKRVFSDVIVHSTEYLKALGVKSLQCSHSLQHAGTKQQPSPVCLFQSCLCDSSGGIALERTLEPPGLYPVPFSRLSL